MGAIDQMLGELFGRVSHQIPKPQDPFLARLLQWTAQVQMHALSRWRTVAASGLRCRQPVGAAGGPPHECLEPAIGACQLCQGETCLEHAVVAATGNFACAQCMAAMEELVREKRGAGARQSAWWATPPRAAEPPPGAWPGSPPNGAPPEEDERVVRARHLSTLGLVDPVTEDEVREQYRALAKKHHPDRASASNRQDSERRLKKINAAYDWLKRHRKAA